MERLYTSPSVSELRARLTPRQAVGVAIGVAAAYLVGAQVGLALTFVPATTSVLWPPNAILTATLLLVPVRSWWLCLGAAFPVHLALEMGAGFSPLLVVLLFLSNCSEALIAAGGLRRLGGAPPRFDTLQRVVLFICVAGLLAPIVSSFFDAAIVALLRDEPYWNVWRTRVFANMLTELSVVPALVLGFEAVRQRRWCSGKRMLEGTALVASLLVVAAAVFGDLRFGSTVPGIPQTPTVFILPWFFWAAVRFGVGGVSMALLASAVVASVATATGHRPFEMLPPLESLLAVQLYLTVIGAALMCLGGLLDERRQAAADLAERLQFEGLLAQLSASFVRPRRASVRSAYDECLGRLGEFLHADIVLLATGPTMRGDARYCQWRRGEAGPNVVGRGAAQFAWAQALVDNGDTVAIASLDALPARASADRAALEALNLQSAVLVPFVTRGAVHGVLTIGCGSARDWRSNEIRQIRVLAEVLSNASAREQAEFEVQRAHQELAQVARMVSMGELTTSLAHDLNQPLTGILSNAQAASRFLDDDQPPLTELREIVSDIIDDNRRARDVITRMRDMLARRDSRREPVDINAVVRDVALLITSETIIRNVSVTMAFAPGPVSVIGARIELQQAMLNVLTNAMEAVADRPVAQRLIDVAVEGDVHDDADETAEVRIVVRDSGAGLAPGTEAHLFEPCFDEDQPGGIGLAVARSIVENHGGMIAASCGSSGGAVVTILLPQAQGSSVK